MNAPHTATQLSRPIPEAFVQALQARFGTQCSTAQAVREQHGRDEGSIDAPPPVAVVYAQSTQDVADCVKLAAQYNVPVIPYGAGTSLEGHLLAVQGGVSLDVSHMNQVVRVNAEDMTVTVQPGILRKALNDAIKDQGLFFPIDPGADASIGGMTATRASGTNAVRYGTMRENVLALEVVTASGEIIRTGNRAKKSAAGYDLTRLLVGSEGTLGIFTEITLRLYPLPEAVSAAVCSFNTVADAVHTVIQTIQMGVPIARVELVDAGTIAMVNKHSNLTLREAPTLMMEFHGSPNGVKEQAEMVQDIAAEFEAQGFEWADTPEERTRLFTARHNAYFAAIQSRPGCRSITTDTCVPISRLADCLLDSMEEAKASEIPFFLVGHVGDGNFHFGYLIDPANDDERQRAEALNNALVRRAIAMEGTCTGEHGIGIHKQDFLREECGDGAMAMMRAIKQALDPQNILNPGKIFTL